MLKCFNVLSPLLSSVRLTAYVAKVFAMAINLVEVEGQMICDAVEFLHSTQQPDGHFKEFGTVIHGEMIVRASNISSSSWC